MQDAGGVYWQSVNLHRQVVLVHKAANGAGCFLDRILTREGSAFFLVMGLLSSRVGQHHQVGELRCALLHHGLVKRGQCHGRQGHQAQQRGSAQPQNSGFQLHVRDLRECKKVT